jgi:hypothetical protein
MRFGRWGLAMPFAILVRRHVIWIAVLAVAAFGTVPAFAQSAA